MRMENHRLPRGTFHPARYHDQTAPRRAKAVARNHNMQGASSSRYQVQRLEAVCKLFAITGKEMHLDEGVQPAQSQPMAPSRRIKDLLAEAPSTAPNEPCHGLQTAEAEERGIAPLARRIASTKAMASA